MVFSSDSSRLACLPLRIFFLCCTPTFSSLHSSTSSQLAYWLDSALLSRSLLLAAVLFYTSFVSASLDYENSMRCFLSLCELDFGGLSLMGITSSSMLECLKASAILPSSPATWCLRTISSSFSRLPLVCYCSRWIMLRHWDYRYADCSSLDCKLD